MPATELARDTGDVLLVSPERLANDRVVRDIVEQLGHRPPVRRARRLPWWLTSEREERPAAGLVIQRGPLARPSLRIQVLRLDDQAKRLAWPAAFLKRDGGTIEPRKQWPDRRAFSWNGVSLNPRNEPGRVLSVYGDAGWGSLVKSGKYDGGRFSDALVAAAATLIRERWMPDPPPAWVTAVPSLRHPRLLGDFAGRLAGSLGLPFDPVLIKTCETAEQKTMANSAHQLRNVAGAFAIERTDLRSGPVLLVDDIVDSRWTLTFCGALLRAAGCRIVYPFALARADSGQ